MPDTKKNVGIRNGLNARLTSNHAVCPLGTTAYQNETCKTTTSTMQAPLTPSSQSILSALPILFAILASTSQG